MSGSAIDKISVDSLLRQSADRIRIVQRSPPKVRES